MSEDLKRKIDSFNTIIIGEIVDFEDVLNAKIHYLSGSFRFANLPNYKTVNEIIAAINPHGEVCEGIGYELYKKKIIDAFLSIDKKSSSFILPLRVEETKRNFLLHIIHEKKCINVLFVYFDEESGLSNIDEYVAGSYKDRLTGLFNFSTLLSHLSNNDKNGFLCLFDLNKFKKINDTYGHAVGDDVLYLCSSYMIAISSNKEIFYRRSGDEFMILFLDSEFEHAKKMIDKIENYLEEIPNISLSQYEGLECSASFGLLELRYDNNDKIETLDLTKLTDLAMYQAKKSNKRMHYISYEDSIEILRSGKLEQRLKSIAKNNR